MITGQMLRDLDACPQQIELFEKLFPNGTEVTEELCIKHALDFDWWWCVDKLLNLAGVEKFNEAMEEARHEFRTVVDPARQNYVIKEYTTSEYERIYLQEVKNLAIAEAKALAKAFAKAFAGPFAKAYLASS